MSHSKKLEHVRRTHEIFNGITNSDLILASADPPGRTDCETFIALPFEDPEVEIIHEHEWAHRVGKTNLRARALFVESYAKTMAERGHDERESKELLRLTTGLLDDLRVTSIWDLLYPKSADDLRARWRRILMSQRGEQAAPMQLMAVGLGVVQHTVWRSYNAVFAEAVSRVNRTGYAAVLATTRWLIDMLVGEARMPTLPGEPLPPGQAQPRRRVGSGGRSSVSNLLDGSRKAAPFLDTPREAPGPDPDPEATKKAVDAALGISTTDEIQRILEESRLEVAAMVRAVQQHTRPQNLDKQLLANQARVSFVDLHPSELELCTLTQEDRRLITALRDRFIKVSAKRRRRMSDSGTELDPNRYIDFLLGSGDDDFFIDDSISKGFDALLLIDMSGSMRRRWEAMSRTAKIVATALDFPHVALDVWGFSGSMEGAVAIFRFLDPKHGFIPLRAHPLAWGLTPIHQAAPVAVRKLRKMPGSTAHLFLVTDGKPQAVMEKDLRPEVALSLREAHRLGVHTTTLIIGHEVSDEDANMMFGRQRWARIDDGETFPEVISVVERAFSNYLRR
jgi:hypothetical protein